MNQMFKYYLPFRLDNNVNYSNIITLYRFADFNPRTNELIIKNFGSIPLLSSRTRISESTLRRMLSYPEYKPFIQYNKENKTIILNNKPEPPFVVLYEQEYMILKLFNPQKPDNLLFKYYLYIKFYCESTRGEIDFTADQFLTSGGYSIKSKSYKDRLTQYNHYLEQQGLINITKMYHSRRARNIYSLTKPFYKNQSN